MKQWSRLFLVLTTMEQWIRLANRAENNGVVIPTNRILILVGCEVKYSCHVKLCEDGSGLVNRIVSLT